MKDVQIKTLCRMFVFFSSSSGVKNYEQQLTTSGEMASAGALKGKLLDDGSSTAGFLDKLQKRPGCNSPEQDKVGTACS